MEPFLVVLALGMIAVVIVEWTVKVWADRRTGDPEVNRSIRNRMMAPVEIPGVALLIIAFVILGLSRVPSSPCTPRLDGGRHHHRLADPDQLGHRRRPAEGEPHPGVRALLGGLGVIAGGVAGAVINEQEFEHEEQEEVPEVGPEQPGGLPARPPRSPRPRRPHRAATRLRPAP